MNAMHCNGQRGDSLIEEDTRRPLNQVGGRLKFSKKQHQHTVHSPKNY